MSACVLLLLAALLCLMVSLTQCGRATIVLFAYLRARRRSPAYLSALLFVVVAVLDVVAVVAGPRVRMQISSMRT